MIEDEPSSLTLDELRQEVREREMKLASALALKLEQVVDEAGSLDGFADDVRGGMDTVRTHLYGGEEDAPIEKFHTK